MKRAIIITLAIALIGLSGSVMAKDNETKYQIDIIIRYNAVSPEEAAKIARQIMIEHSEACKTEVKMKKASNNEYIIFNGSDNSLQLTPYGTMD